MKLWHRILLAGVLSGNAALLVDCFVISVPHVIMIPLLLAAVILIFAGFIMRKKQKKD